MPQILQLEAFVTLAREKNFTRAAEKLHISQPAITARIRSLEAELGCQLFLRTTRHVELTQTGLELLSSIEKGLSLIDDVLRSVSTKALHPKPLAIACTPSMMAYWAPSFFEQLRQISPALQVRLSSSVNKEILKMVDDETIDVGMVNINFLNQIPRSVKHIVLFDDPYLFVVGSGFALNYQRPLPLHLLEKIPQIAYMRTSTFWQSLDSFLASHDIQPDIIVELDNFEAIKEIVASNQGATFLPKTICSRELENGSLVEVELQGNTLKRQVAAVYKRERETLRPVKTFIETIERFQSIS